MSKSTYQKTSFVLGEISPRVFGRFESTKPIFRDGAAILENFLIFQPGSAFFRPGTQYIATAKQSNPVNLQSFKYSTQQAYVIEIGNTYFRYYANSGQLQSMGSPVETSTPYLQEDIFSLQFANKADVAYITNPNYAVYKLVRTNATTFTLSAVNFIRGPFLDSNVTATTITASSATGDTTLTASTAIFQAGHVGSLWRVGTDNTVANSAVVLITAFTDSTHVNGTVQAEPSGTAGNIGTTSAVTFWAEGAWSAVRGYPAAVTFHENRLVFGGTTYEPQKFWASAVGAYENFSVGTATDSDAYTYEILSNLVNAIRWMSSSGSLQIGTSGGTVTAADGSTSGITPSAPPNITIDTDYSVMYLQPHNISSYLFYVTANTYQLRQLVFDFVINKQKSEDMTLLADHILRDGGGAVGMKRQESPTDRIWIVRADGQLAILTRNVEQQVTGWTRMVAGTSTGGNGLFKGISVIPVDGSDDQVWVSVQRVINGSTVQFIELFTPELFNNPWEPVRMDASLSINAPITITGITQAKPGVITAPSHGLSTSNIVKIDNVVGMTQINQNSYTITVLSSDTFSIQDSAGNNIDTTSFSAYVSGGQVRLKNTTFNGLSYLNGETVVVTTDGGLPAAQQSFVVSGGSITLPNPAAVVHVGLPYKGTLQFLQLGEDVQGQTSQTKKRKVYKPVLRFWNTIGGKFGDSMANLFPIIYPPQIPNVIPGQPPALYTGDVEASMESFFSTQWAPFLIQDSPLPMMLLAAVFRGDIEEDK